MTMLPGTVLAYHERSKHALQRYAAGPQTLDWDSQPDPFRHWAGAPVTALPLVADTVPTCWRQLLDGSVPAYPMSLHSLAALFELSFGLTAWKQSGPDRWALRANPSSGNLHPTEAYAIARGVAGLTDGLYHYEPREHALVRRAHTPHGPAGATPGLWIGLSTIHWREAWKYGERAFRYCQLDVGHALGALRFAAAALGWQARVVPQIGHARLRGLLGLDRATDFAQAEPEEPELLVQLGPALPRSPAEPPAWVDDTRWQGRANCLGPRPMYRWPVISEVTAATRAWDPAMSSFPATGAGGEHGSIHDSLPVATLIRQRRSAQQFDRRASMSRASFLRIARATMLGGLPWDAWPHPPRVHAVFYVNRVAGIEPGALILPRSPSGAALLATTLQSGYAWQPVADAPGDMPLHRLAENPALAGTLRTLSCHQAIASDACLTLSLIAECDDAWDQSPWCYRALFQEAGLLGQSLYLNAEAEGLRGTGIGCYFDDAVHELLGMRGQRLQVLYHFTIGVALPDTRCVIEPPYSDRAPVNLSNDAHHE